MAEQALNAVSSVPGCVLNYRTIPLLWSLFTYFLGRNLGGLFRCLVSKTPWAPSCAVVTGLGPSRGCYRIAIALGGGYGYCRVTNLIHCTLLSVKLFQYK